MGNDNAGEFVPVDHGEEDHTHAPGEHAYDEGDESESEEDHNDSWEDHSHGEEEDSESEEDHNDSWEDHSHGEEKDSRSQEDSDGDQEDRSGSHQPHASDNAHTHDHDRDHLIEIDDAEWKHLDDSFLMRLNRPMRMKWLALRRLHL